jgi:integrase
MASIQDRREQGKGWRVRYRDPDGKQRSRSFAKWELANRFANSVEVDIDRGEYHDPRAGHVTVKEWAEQWFAMTTPTLKPSTAAAYRSLLDSRIYPRFGRTRLSNLRPSDIQTFVAELTAEGLSASRVRHCAIVLRMVMAAAVNDGLIRTNPVLGIRQPKIDRAEAAYFEPAVVDAIAEAMPTAEYLALIRVLGIGGLRFGEAAALTRDRVDLLRRRLVVRETLSEVGGRLHRSSTKSYQARTVPLSPALAEQLAAHLGANVDTADDAPVFHAPAGGNLRHGAFYHRRWLPTLETLKLPAVGLHVLRHSAAARMIQAGASPKAVQSIMGHKSAGFTLTAYGHLFESDLDDLAGRLETGSCGPNVAPALTVIEGDAR